MSRPPPASDHERSGATPLGGAVSLEWKLPLLMTASLAAGLAVMLAFSYAILRERAEAPVRDRLADASREVAGTAAASMVQLGGAMREVAGDSAVVRTLRAARGEAVPEAGAAAARAALAELAEPGDTTVHPIELWDARGRRVAFVGRDLPAADRRFAPLDASAGSDGAPGAVRFGPVHPVGGRVRFWALAPVVAGGERLGFVARPSWVGGPRNVQQMLGRLLGEDVTLSIRNADGSFWAAGPGVPSAAPLRRDSTPEGLVFERAGVGRLLAGEAPVAGTPWVVVLETPERWVLARPRSTARRLAVLSLVLTAVGAALSWAISRRVTRPLATLTAAAEAVAAGRYQHAVAGAGRDEIGRLAASFDAMARQVAAARRELEGRVGEAERARADAEHARAEAELANRAKSDFLAVMSHELRTPLNAIGGYAQLLEMGLHGPVTEAQKDALARIGRSQEHLLALINDVLGFARIDAGQVRYAMDDVPLHETLAELESLVAPQVRAGGLDFRCRPCAPEVAARADRDRLRQVMLNLLGNAIKYTPRGGSVAVECEADARQVRVHVRDTGTGIRPERLPHIFEPFVQGERALNRPDEGVGLGLAISRELARGMGGELRVASEVGKGSTFTLVLARSGAAGPAALPGVPVLDSATAMV